MFTLFRKLGPAAVIAAVLLSGACTQVSEGNTVRVPTFGDPTPAGSPTPTAPPTAPATGTTTWTPTWEASIPTVAPVVKPTTAQPPAPKPVRPKPPVVTTTPPAPPPQEPTVEIPDIPGVPFAQEGGRCTEEGAVAIARSGAPLVCTRSGRGGQPRWRKP